MVEIEMNTAVYNTDVCSGPLESVECQWLGFIFYQCLSEAFRNIFEKLLQNPQFVEIDDTQEVQPPFTLICNLKNFISSIRNLIVYLKSWTTNLYW
jgi:hypothetical protein